MSLAERLEQVYSGAVYDVLRAMGRHDCLLPAEIRPIDINQRLAGPVFTVAGRRDDALDDHETLFQWTGLLSKAPPDSVIVCQPNDNVLAHMGELSAEALQLRGVRGYIVDGGCRDSDFICRIGFPVFCRYFTPADVVGRWVAEDLGQPITIGQIKINNGDYVIADRDGVVVIPADRAEEVVAEAEMVVKTESEVRKAIRRGVEPQEAYLKYGAF